MIQLFGEIAEEADAVYTTDTVKQLIGREPKSLKAFIEEFRQVYGG